MKKSIVFMALTLLVGCKSEFKVISRKDIKLDSIATRAIFPFNNGVYFGGTNAKAGFISFENHPAESKIIQLQKEKTDFRSLAVNGDVFIMNAGSPANLYKISMSNSTLTSELVYTESGEKVFYDSMHFEGKLGVIIGDPTENCLSVLITNDGGKNWTKIPCANLPKTVDGEAAFAASDTNVKIIDDCIFIVSGGVKSRLFKSTNKGITWEVFDTPIIQGKAITGAFSMDFYDKNNGIIVGGDYDNQKNNINNKAITNDGGKTWKLIAENESFGYASCVQFAPNSSGKTMVSCGSSGVFITRNKGKKWYKIADDTDFYTIRFSGKNTIVLGGSNKVSKISFE